MSHPSRRVRRKKQAVPVVNQPTRSKAEERMIKVMTDKGGKRFRVLRSAETGIKNYQRPVTAAARRAG
jgi:hypothetical protein